MLKSSIMIGLLFSLLSVGLCSIGSASDIPPEAEGPWVVVSPETVFPDEPNNLLTRTFYQTTPILMEDEIFLYLQTDAPGPEGSPGLPWEHCYHDQIVLFRGAATLDGIKGPFTVEKRVSRCECPEQGCSEPDNWVQEMGTVIQSKHDGKLYLIAQRVRFGTNWANGDFRAWTLGVSDDGIDWTWPSLEFPLIDQSEICDPVCRVYSVTSPALISEEDHWWGFFNWGTAATLNNRTGRIRIFPDVSRPNGFRTEIMSGGKWVVVNTDGTFDSIPDNVWGFAIVQGLTKVDDEYFLWADWLSTEDVAGCTEDELNFGSTLLSRKVTPSSMESVRELESNVRPIPSANATGRIQPSLLVDRDGRKVLFSGSTDKVCETVPAWPQGGNTFWGIEILTTVLSDSIVEDLFSETAARPSGTSLSGTDTEIGDQQWQGSPGLKLIDGRITNQGVDGIYAAGFSTPTKSSGLGYWELESAIDLEGSGWVGVGFNGTATSGLYQTGQIWLLLHQNETWSVLADGLSETVGSGSTFEIAQPGVNQVRLRYDPALNRVEASINETIVLPWAAVTHGVVDSFVGFTFFDDSGISGETILDDLKLRAFSRAIFSDDFESGDTSSWSN